MTLEQSEFVRDYLDHMNGIGYKIVDTEGSIFLHDPYWYKVDKNGIMSTVPRHEMNDAILATMQDICYSYQLKG